MAGSANSVSPLLAHHLSNATEGALLLITYVLGASANWLLLRLVLSTLKDNPDQPPTGIILISFLRNYTFWRDSSRKLGLDLGRSAAQNRFLFVDGLTELFSGAHGGKPGVQDDHVVLRDAKLPGIEKAILDLMGRMNANPATQRTILLVDGLDFVMAATGATAFDVGDMLMEWRQNVHSVAVTASADSPLVHEPETQLETNHRTHVVGLGHQANRIMGLRLLDSGTAKDVSGVLSVSRGAMVEAEDGIEEAEYLYFVGGDGGVRVFERGAG